MAVLVDGTELDLHNGGTFIGYRYSVATRKLEMTWHCDLWPKNQRVCLTLNFPNVHFLEITVRDPEMPVEEDETLSFLVLNLIDNNSKESQIEFNFFGGMKILVKARLWRHILPMPSVTGSGCTWKGIFSTTRDTS
jgi:hypothetical protein